MPPCLTLLGSPGCTLQSETKKSEPTLGLPAMTRRCAWQVAKGRRRELDPRGKTHWVNARSVAVCDRTACRRAFTLNERRHHCRVCGKVYCDACSPKDLNLTYFLTDPDASGEGGESTGGEEDALASLGEGEQLPLQRGCAGCKRDLERMRLTAHTRRLVDGAGAHVLRNLYHPVSGYVAAIKGAMSSLERSVGYLERMCELAGPQDGDSVHLATADVLELKVAHPTRNPTPEPRSPKPEALRPPRI